VENSVIAFLRKAADPSNSLLFCCNFTPVVRNGYRFGVPAAGAYDEVFNTDAECFGGGNVRNDGGMYSQPVECHGRPNSIVVTLPPLAVVAFRRRP